MSFICFNKHWTIKMFNSVELESTEYSSFINMKSIIILNERLEKRKFRLAGSSSGERIRCIFWPAEIMPFQLPSLCRMIRREIFAERFISLRKIP